MNSYIITIEIIAIGLSLMYIGLISYELWNIGKDEEKNLWK